MKKIFFLVFFVSAMLLMNLYVFSGTKDEYIQYLKKHTNEPIQKVFYDDFDNNGSYEMFAIVGKETPEGTIIGNIYYINDLFTQHNQVSLDDFEENHVFCSDGIKIVDLGSCKHLYINRWFQTSNLTLVYETHRGTPLLNIGNMNYIDNNNIICNVSSYDICYLDGSWSGHSWKDYWFYWDDKNKEYCEYAAIPITKEQLLMFDGAAQILNDIDGEITDILYRGNGIININIKHGRDSSSYSMENYTLGYDNSKVWLELKNAGYYLPSIGDKKNKCYISANYPSFVNPVVKKKISIVLNGDKLSFDKSPYIEKGTTMVPMRAIFEALGAEVLWNDQYKSAFVKYGNKGLIFTLNNSNAYVVEENNDKLTWKNISLDIVPTNVNGSTFIPLRSLTESLGCVVEWNEDIRQIKINYDTNKKGTDLSNKAINDINATYYAKISEDKLFK